MDKKEYARLLIKCMKDITKIVEAITDTQIKQDKRLGKLEKEVDMIMNSSCPIDGSIDLDYNPNNDIKIDINEPE